MSIISNVISNGLLHRFQAPIGMMYEITDIQTTILTAGNNILLMTARQVEDEITILSVNQEFFFAQTTDLTNTFHTHFSEPIKTKYISIAPDGSTVFLMTYVINYRLVKASTAELVYEFVSRGKKP